MRGQGADDFGEQTAGDENAAGFLSVDVHGRLSGNLVVEPGQPQGVGGGVGDLQAHSREHGNSGACG